MKKIILILATVILFGIQAKADISYFEPMAGISDAQYAHFLGGMAANKHLEDMGLGIVERVGLVAGISIMKECLDASNGFKFDDQDIWIGVTGAFFSVWVDFMVDYFNG